MRYILICIQLEKASVISIDIFQRTKACALYLVSKLMMAIVAGQCVFQQESSLILFIVTALTQSWAWLNAQLFCFWIV